jgi:S-layer homology domain
MQFTDVPPSHPFYEAIMALAAAGLMTGEPQSNGTRKFYPERPITRGEFAAVLARMNIADALDGYVEQ